MVSELLEKTIYRTFGGGENSHCGKRLLNAKSRVEFFFVLRYLISCSVIHILLSGINCSSPDSILLKRKVWG